MLPIGRRTAFARNRVEGNGASRSAQYDTATLDCAIACCVIHGIPSHDVAVTTNAVYVRRRNYSISHGLVKNTHVCIVTVRLRRNSLGVVVLDDNELLIPRQPRIIFEADGAGTRRLPTHVHGLLFLPDQKSPGSPEGACAPHTYPELTRCREMWL